MKQMKNIVTPIFTKVNKNNSAQSIKDLIIDMRTRLSTSKTSSPLSTLISSDVDYIFINPNDGIKLK